jgi:hypothetical protein
MKHRDVFSDIVVTYIKNSYPKDSIKPRWGEHGLEIARCLTGWSLEWKNKPILFRNGTNELYIGSLEGDDEFMEIAQLVIRLAEQHGVAMTNFTELDNLVKY